MELIRLHHKQLKNLKKKHPHQEPTHKEAFLPEENIIVPPVIFEQIYAATIRISAQLAEEMACLFRRLYSEMIPYEFISTLMSFGLVLLKKLDDSVSTVGIGETLRQIIS